MPPPIPSFSSLPPEILDIILSHISNDTYQPSKFSPPPGARPDPADSLVPESTRTLISLSSTCHRLRTPTLIHIYSLLSLIWTTWTDPPIILLLRTFLCRPDLAALVTQVTLTGWAVILRENSKKGVDALFSNEERNKLILWMAELGIGGRGDDINNDVVDDDDWLDDDDDDEIDVDEEDWHSAVFTKGDCDAITAIFLSLLSNLHKLHLELDYSHLRVHPVYLYKLLQPTIATAIPERPRLFPKLECIDMCTQRYQIHHYNHPRLVPRFDTDPNVHVLPFLATSHMPLLSSMDFNLANALPFTPPPGSIGISQSLKSLTLTTMHADTLAGLLQVCPRVETVQYMLLRQIYLGDEYEYADMTRLREALEIRSDTLRSVAVILQWHGKEGRLHDHEYNYRRRRLAPSQGPAESVGYRGSLLPFGREMVRLERLSASLTVLVGMERMEKLEKIHKEGKEKEELGFSFAEMLPNGLRELWVHRFGESFLWKSRYFDPCVSILVDQLLDEKAPGHAVAAKLETVSYPQVLWYSEDEYDEYDENGDIKCTIHELPPGRVRNGKEVGVHVYHNRGVMDWEPRWVGHYMDSDNVKPGQERGYRFDSLLEYRARPSRKRDGKVEMPV